MIKKILIIVAVLLAIPFVIALFVRKEYFVEKKVMINQPNDKVFQYLKYLKNQDNFSKWAKMDEKMIKSYTGEDGTEGFVSRWESLNEDVGTGEQEIKHIAEGSRIDYELRFIKPFESVSNAFVSTEALATGQTKVIWGFEGKMNYPMNLMLLVMDFEKMIGDDLQEGLNNLKLILEQ